MVHTTKITKESQTLIDVICILGQYNMSSTKTASADLVLHETTNRLRRKLHDAKMSTRGYLKSKLCKLWPSTVLCKKSPERFCPLLTPLVKLEMTEFEGENTQETRRTNREVKWPSLIQATTQ